MIETPMDVLKNFPARKTKKQKQAFRDSVQSYAEGICYEVSIEKAKFGSRNIIIGNPDTAKLLITAHYDTPACMVVPNFITPCNFLSFLGYQLLVTALIFAVAAVPGLILYAWSANSLLAFYVALLFVYVLLGLMMFGPGNKNNANDNTSGVVTVLETAAALPENLRAQVCFVLFDLEEAGLVGSSGYFSRHKKTAKDQLILNCDCVGDGNNLMMFPTKRLKKNERFMEILRSVCCGEGEKTLVLREKGFSYYPSDQNNFPIGVGIAAFNRSKWVGLYCDKIHTNKDTVLDANNVSFLRDRLIEIVRRAV